MPNRLNNALACHQLQHIAAPGTVRFKGTAQALAKHALKYFTILQAPVANQRQCTMRLQQSSSEAHPWTMWKKLGAGGTGEFKAAVQ